MTVNEIMQVFTNVMGTFAPAITVILGIVAAAIGIRWVIRIFVK